MSFYKKLSSFFLCYVRSGIKDHPVRLAMLGLYCIAHYFFQSYFLGAKGQYVNQILLGYTTLFKTIETSISSIMTIPIRNSAIANARLEYIEQSIKPTLAGHDRINFGPNYAVFKRLENIFSGVERDLLSIIKYLPLFILSAFTLINNSTNKWIPSLLIILNTTSILYIPRWYKLRSKAYDLEEKVNSEVLRFFQNIDRSEVSDNIQSITNKTIVKEIQAYSTAILNKQYYKLLILVPNIIVGFILLRTSFQDQLKVNAIVLLVYNWIQLSLASMSTVGMLAGMRTFKFSPESGGSKEVKDILISNLSVPNVFDDITLRIKHNEKVLITGPNGAGKSLLLQSIAHRARVNYILINTISSAFLQEKSALKTNKFWQEHMSEKYDFLLDEKFLSTGQSSFVALATVLLYEPQVILVDEALDLLSLDMMKDALFLLNSLDSTLIVVTHRSELIEEFPRRLHIESMKINDTQQRN